MAYNQKRKKITRRKFSDNDVTLTKHVVSSGVKGAVFLGFNMASTPAILATLAIEISGGLMARHKDRINKLIYNLFYKIQSLTQKEKERWQSRFDEEEGQQFFEAACYQAAKTVDPEKLEAIAALVKNSLSAEELELHHARWLLRLIDQIDVVEIILLQWHLERFHNDTTFLAHHTLISEGSKKPQMSFWEYEEDLSEEEKAKRIKKKQKFEIERERYALYTSRINHLVEIGLLGEVPGTRYQELTLTPLGAALLKIIDIADDTDWGMGEQASTLHALHQVKAQADDSHRNAIENERQHQREIQNFARGLKGGLERAKRLRPR